MIDQLDIAYIARGAFKILEQRSSTGPVDIDKYSGELGFIDEVLGHAKALDAVAKQNEEALSAYVFVYDVAEPFGERIATALLDGTSTMAIAECVVSELLGDATASLKKTMMVCSKCGSANCGLDATARFDPDAGEYALNGTFDNSWCDGCGMDDPGLDEAPFNQAKYDEDNA